MQWIKTCVSTASFSVLVNGVPGSCFVPSRGIRQGDPLSPYLFILSAELQARHLSFASNQPGKLVGVPIGLSGVRIPFLTFADHTMIFAKATDQSCLTICQILDKLCSMSSQMVNYHKSAFQFSPNVSQDLKGNFGSILGMTETQDLGEYLGCPVISIRVTKKKFGKVVAQVDSQLPKWKANSLSQGGRIVLIQSNLATKANFQMQSFFLPKSILNKLDKSYWIFWNKNSLSSSSNLVGWDRICRPKNLGGLGLRKAEPNNIALQMKLLWKLLKDPNNLWVQLVSGKYVKNQPLLTHTVSSLASWQWRNLMKLRLYSFRV